VATVTLERRRGRVCVSSRRRIDGVAAAWRRADAIDASRNRVDGVAAAWRRADAIDASRNRADALAIMKTLPQHLVEVPSFFVQVPVVLLELLPQVM
jgi:hypothetical protein